MKFNQENLKKVFIKGMGVTLSTLMLVSVMGCANKIEPKNEDPINKPAVEQPVTTTEEVVIEKEEEDITRYNGQQLLAMSNELLASILNQDLIGVNGYNNLLIGAYCNHGDEYSTYDAMTAENKVDSYVYVGQAIHADLSDDGKLSPLWNEFFPTEKDAQRFQTEVVLPLEQAYAGNNYETVITDLSVEETDYITNIKISTLYIIFQYMETKDKDIELYNKIRDMHEKNYNGYLDGNNVSLSTNTSSVHRV